MFLIPSRKPEVTKSIIHQIHGCLLQKEWMSKCIGPTIVKSLVTTDEQFDYSFCAEWRKMLFRFSFDPNCSNMVQWPHM